MLSNTSQEEILESIFAELSRAQNDIVISEFQGEEKWFMSGCHGESASKN